MNMKNKIIVNKARCKNCLDIIESKNVHDFVACSCFKNRSNTTGIFIDGGAEYFRQGGNLKNLERLDK